MVSARYLQYISLAKQGDMIDLVTSIVLIAAMFAGVSAYRLHLNRCRTQHENEIKAARDREMLACLRVASEQETERLAIMARLTHHKTFNPR